MFLQNSSVSIRVGVVHNIPSLSGPSHVIHRFLEAMWHSQRQVVVQAFVLELCRMNDSSLVELAELKTLAQDIKVEKCTSCSIVTGHVCITYLQGFKPEKLDKTLEDKEIDDIITSHMIYSREVLMLQEGQQSMLSNGRVSFKILIYSIILHTSSRDVNFINPIFSQLLTTLISIKIIGNDLIFILQGTFNHEIYIH